jgi:hypothetical protein
MFKQKKRNLLIELYLPIIMLVFVGTFIIVSTASTVSEVSANFGVPFGAIFLQCIYQCFCSLCFHAFLGIDL